MNIWLSFHIIFMILWFACFTAQVSIEVVAKRELVNPQRAALLHYLLAVYLLLPIILVLLISGGALYDVNNFVFPTYKIKIAFGMLALLLSGLGIIPVMKRKRASDSGNETNMTTNTKKVMISLIVAIISAVVSLAAGGHIVGII